VRVNDDEFAGFVFAAIISTALLIAVAFGLGVV
jgi:hypothetical protein